MCARECVRGMHVGAGEAPGCRTPSPYSLYSPYRFYLELRREVDAVEHITYLALATNLQRTYYLPGTAA